MLTDEDDVPVWRASYEAFGKASISADPDGSIPTANPNITFNVRFPGQYYDAESGLHYNRYRYYDPSIGRYISADPIGQFSGANLFRYAGSNPLRFSDFLGLLFGGAVNAGEGYGAYAASFYAGITTDPCASTAAKAAAWAGGLFASLWTPETSDATAAALLAAWGASQALAGADAGAPDANAPPDYGSTPEGRPYTKHYGTETGPERNIPGSVVDQTVNENPGVDAGDGKTVHHDPNNNVTVVTGDGGGIVSAHKGKPRRGQY
jgi:RHS repeat-associated protein